MLKFVDLISKKVRGIIAMAIAIMLFSCGNHLEDFQKKELQNRFPQGEAYNFELTYTDSAKVKAIVRSPLNEDFSNVSFPYSIFPKGLEIFFYDDHRRLNKIRAKYGIIYLQTKLVELRDSVVLITYDGRKLQTEQLFWDQKQDWVFTEQPFSLTDTIRQTVTRGKGLDFDKSMSLLKAHQITGVLPLKEEEETHEAE